MSEFNARGQRVEAFWLHANTQEAVAVWNNIATYDLTLCIDKEERVLWHQGKLLLELI